MSDYYIDLRITANDLTLDPAGEPLLLANRDSIVQDLRHLIRESGLLVECVGERNPNRRADLLQRLELLVEEDVRLVPGTVAVAEPSLGVVFITAQTVHDGEINFEAITL